MQEEKLRELLEYVAEYSPFYKERFAKYGIDSASIRSLADLQRIPVTTKSDLQTRNQDFLCVDRSRVAEYTATSGTLGSPVTIALTAKDLERLAYNEYHSF